MLIRIAWRNIWRNPLRSLVVMIAITAGIAALSFGFGFYNGFVVDFIENSITSEYSHIQIHNPAYKRDKEIQYDIANVDRLLEEIKEIEGIKAVTKRTISNGMISSPTTASGVTVYGIDPEKEALVTQLDSTIREGNYFGKRRNPVLISKKMAAKLKLKMRSKLVLTFQDLNGDIVAGAFRVAGIFETKSPRMNESVVFVRASDLQGILGVQNQAHEVALLLDDLLYEDTVMQQLQASHQGLLVESWRTLAPELELVQTQVIINMGIILGIIMLALGFGIVNTMLMAVLERYKEIGMLMAVGMKKINVFGMIMTETIMLTIVGGPLGFLIGVGVVEHYDTNGIDLTNYSQGLQELGYESILYPAMELKLYLMIAFGVIITAVLASIYPAVKAVKLEPIEALRKL